MGPLVAIDLDPIFVIVLMDSLERAVKASSTGVLWVASRIQDLNYYQANRVKGRASMELLVNKSIKPTTVLAHLVGRGFSATLKWYPVKTLHFERDQLFPNYVVTVANVKI